MPSTDHRSCVILPAPREEGTHCWGEQGWGSEVVQTDVQEEGPESHTAGGRGRAGLNHPCPLTPASQAGPQSSSPKSHHAPRFHPTESTTTL